METLVLTRKGESEGNIKGVYQGQSTEVHLSERGCRQAELLRDALKKQFSIEVIITSPLIRAQETAEIVARILDVPVEVNNDLIEMDFGQFEGRNISEARHMFPEVVQAWKTKPSTCHLPGGERFSDVLERADHFLEAISNDKRKTALAVTHDAVLRTLLTKIERNDPDKIWNYQLFNCSITEVNFASPEPSVVRLNEADHLTTLVTDTKKEAL